MAEQKSPTGLKKVTRAPKALKSTAELANAIVDYMGRTRGLGGIVVQIAEAGMVIGYKTGIEPKPANLYAGGFNGSGGGSGSGGSTASTLSSAVTVAGTLPTSTELATALTNAYGSQAPAGGDIVNLTVSGVLKFRAIITLVSAGPTGVFQVQFTYSGVFYYGQIHQTGLY